MGKTVGRQGVGEKAGSGTWHLCLICRDPHQSQAARIYATNFNDADPSKPTAAAATFPGEKGKSFPSG